MFTKPKIAMLVAEFLGTAILVLAFLSVSVSNIGIGYFIAFAAGLAMVIMTLALAPVSGAILNPAITLGLWSARKIETMQALLYIVVQLLGGLLAYVLFIYMTGSDLSGRKSEFKSEVLVAEVVGTAVFAMGFAAAVYNKWLGGYRAVMVGGALALGIIIASANSGAGYLNPSIALGAHVWNWGNFALGPVLGALIGVNLYGLLFAANKSVAAASKTGATVKAKTTKKVVTRKKK